MTGEQGVGMVRAPCLAQALAIVQQLTARV
jgi:hypothetical protein